MKDSAGIPPHRGTIIKAKYRNKQVDQQLF